MPPTPHGQQMSGGPSRPLGPAAWSEGVVASPLSVHPSDCLVNDLGRIHQRDPDRPLAVPRVHARTKGLARTACRTPATCRGGPSPARKPAADLPL